MLHMDKNGIPMKESINENVIYITIVDTKWGKIKKDEQADRHTRGVLMGGQRRMEVVLT
jgi:hypothetical protein